MDGELVSHWTHLVLTWIGFGTLIGLLAKAILPGRDPGGALATPLIGIMGSVIGVALLALVSDGLRVSPISPLGFVAALGGTTILFISYRLLHARSVHCLFRGLRWHHRPRRRISIVDNSEAPHHL